MLLYHIADVHIGAGAKYLGEKLYDIQKRHLENLYEEAVKEGANFVVIAGDLFDSNSVPSSVAREVFDIFTRYVNVNTVILPGGGSHYEGEVTGHDAYTEDSIYKRPDISLYFEKENIYLLSPETPVIKVDDVAFYAGFFEVPVYPKERAIHHIAVIHGAFGKDVDELDPSLLDRTFYDYIALGHYHMYKRFGKAAYPGAFIQFEFTRAKILESGYLKVRIYNGLEIERVVFEDAPRFYRVELIDESDIDRLESEMRFYDFIEIEGYSEDIEDKVKNIFKNKNIKLRDDAYIIKKDAMWHVLNSIIEKIMAGDESENREEIKSFMMRFLRKKTTKPELERVLRRFFEL